jgi:Putative transmembrane protein (Alph_Pro_TM)
MSTKIRLLTLAALLTMPFTAGAPAAFPATAKVTPPVVEMGTFYGGTELRVEGTVASGSKVVVIVRGKDVTELFNRVGRVGPIWINTGKLSVSGVPSLLLVFSSEPVCDCLCRRAMDDYMCDVEAIKKQVRIKPEPEDADSIVEDFLNLKVRQGNYQMSGGGVRVGSAAQALGATSSLVKTSDPAEVPPSTDGTEPYSLEFTWPKSAAAGTYEIRVHACRDGEVKESSVVPLKVVEVGFPAMIASSAREHASAYGIASIVIAMLAGFGIDFVTSRIFKKRIASH